MTLLIVYFCTTIFSLRFSIPAIYSKFTKLPIFLRLLLTCHEMRLLSASEESGSCGVTGFDTVALITPLLRQKPRVCF